MLLKDFYLKRYLRFVINYETNDFVKLFPLVKAGMRDLESFEDRHKLTRKEIEFNQMALAEILLKMCRTNKDKYLLMKHLLDIIPSNVELVKWFMNYCGKENQTKRAVQLIYDHLTIHCIKNDSLWLL